MPRYIDADKLLARYKERLCAGCKKTKNYCEHCCDIPDIISDIEDAPTADVVERKTGKWEIYVISPFDGEGCRCSECKYEGVPYWNFCPTCGADMRGDGNDN